MAGSISADASLHSVFPVGRVRVLETPSFVGAG